MRYRLAIFDFDGTLADTFSWFVRQLDGVADRFGLDRVDLSELEALRGQSAQQLVERLRIPTWKLPLIARYMRKLARQENNQVRLFAGVEQVFECLAARGVKLAIVSSNAEQVVRRALGEAVARHIDHFACGASLFGKAGMFRKVLRHAQVPRDATICIGDEIRDAEAARSEGLAFGAVSWGFNHPEALRAQKPDAFFQRMEDIPALFASASFGRLASVAPRQDPVAALLEGGFGTPSRSAI
jgi:phosphoglycolate phosphatase